MYGYYFVLAFKYFFLKILVLVLKILFPKVISILTFSLKYIFKIF